MIEYSTGNGTTSAQHDDIPSTLSADKNKRHQKRADKGFMG
jgi:hypothetical protein